MFGLDVLQSEDIFWLQIYSVKNIIVQIGYCLETEEQLFKP